MFAAGELARARERAGMARIDESRPFIPVRIAVLTMSDTRSLAEDKSGNTLAEMIAEAGHQLVDRALVKDDVATIRARVAGWIADAGVDVVITTGGTGFTGRDVTPEAVSPLFEKHIDGFSTVFHMISFQKIETSTIQSRACGGVANGTYIFCLPGSPGACKDAWHGILKWQLDNRHRPCNFVEIMPRLLEQ
jgi:molybdenum cofactor biosynthesis protein B